MARILTTALLLAATAASAQMNFPGGSVGTGITTWSGPVTVAGDVIIPTGGTLVINPGATVTVATTDALANSDAARVEFIVSGTLNAVGVATGGITLTSAGTTATSWGGIRVQPGGTATLAFVTMDEAQYGLEATNSSTSGVTTSLTISDSTVRSSNRGLVGNGSTSGTLTITATNVAFEALGYGVDMNRGTVSITGSSFYQAPLTMNGGSLSLTTSTVSGVSSSYVGAINYGAGTLAVDRSTISYNATSAIYSCTGSSGAGTVTSSILSHNVRVGIDRCTTNPTLSVSSSNIWGNTNTFGPPPTGGSNVTSNNYNSVSTISNSISANPLFVDGAMRNFRLTSNSPSRQAGASTVDQGALPYTSDATVGLHGKLFTNTTLSGMNSATGDLIVASGVTLTLQPGATLSFATTDTLGNSDAARGELIVLGTLTAIGVDGSPVTFTSAGSTASSWGGIRVQPGGSATISNAIFEEAQYGLEGTNSSTSGVTTSLTISNSTVRTSNRGLVASGSTSGTLTITATNVVFDALGYGVDMNRGTVSVTGSSFYQAPLTMNGGSLSLTTSTVSGVSSSYVGAINYGAGTLAVDRSTISYNATSAIYSCTGSSGSGTVTSSILSHNVRVGIDRCTTNPTLGITSSNIWGNTNTFGPPPTGGSNVTSNNYNSVSSISNSISANPLFVDGPMRNFRLTSNSLSRQAGAGNVDQGALPYTSDATVGLHGKLFSDLTLSGVNTVQGDLVVATGVTLTLQPGATLNFATTDSIGNSDAARGELIVNGTLTAIGVSGTPVTFTSAGSTASSWGGIRVQPGGAASISNALLEEAQYGFEGTNSSTSGVTTSLTLSNSTVRTSNRGLVASGSTSGTLTVTATNVAFEALGYGVDMNRGTVNVSSSTFYQAPLTMNGGSLSVSTTAISGVSSSYVGAINYGAGTLAVDRCTISYNATSGIFSCTGSSGAGTVASSIISHNTRIGIDRCTTNPTLGVSYSNLWGNTNTFGPPPTAGANQVSNNYNSVSTISNSISSNPSFVDGAMRDFRLTSTSLSRGAGAGGVDQGAYPYTTGPITTVTVTPSTTSIGAGATTGFSAQARDAMNNPVGTTFTWAATAAAGTITAAGLYTAGCTPGTYTAAITATAPNGVFGTATVTINVGLASSVAITPSNGPTVKSQTTQQFTATVRDACNNTIMGAPLTWSVASMSGTISAGGLFTAGCQRGTYMTGITATSGSLNASVPVTVGPGDIAAIAVTPMTATVQGGATQQFGAAAADGCGNTVPMPTFTWSTNVTGASINTTGLFTAGQTNGTFNNGITVSAMGATGPVTANANVIVQGGSGTQVSTVTVTPSSPSLAPNGTQQFTAEARNSSGTVVTGLPVTWSVTSGGGTINTTGLFTAGTTANTFTNTVSAVVGGVTGTASVTITPGPVTTITVAPTSVTLAPNGTTTFAATARDAFNNLASASLTWAANTSSGTITQTGAFTASNTPGTYSNAVTASSGSVMGSANVTIQTGALSQLALMPQVATVQAGAQVAFTATGRDSSGNTVAITPTWTVVSGGGTVSSTGVFTAGTTAGTFANTVRVEASGLTSFATVIVTPGAVISVAVTPASATLASGAQQQFTAAASDAFNNSVPAAITWTATSAAGTITAGGLFTAGATAGAYSNAVTATASGISGSANVTVTGGAGGGSAGGGSAAGGSAAGGSAAGGSAAGGSAAGGSAAGGSAAGGSAGGGSAGGGSAGGGDAGGSAGGGSSGVGGGTIGFGGGTAGGGGTVGPPPSGCGCSSFDGVTPLFGLALMLLARRRR